MPNRYLAYDYIHARPNSSMPYLMPAVLGALKRYNVSRVFDLGCGTGDAANALAGEGFDVAGVDPSRDGIDKANEKYPDLDLRLGSSEDDLFAQHGAWDAAISLEVIEHVYDPVAFVACLYRLVKPGGVVIISTPYHGYVKNLALAVTGRMDSHFMPLVTHGHIKFWSVVTLKALVRRAGFVPLTVKRVGRVSVVAKSIVLVAAKPR